MSELARDAGLRLDALERARPVGFAARWAALEALESQVADRLQALELQGAATDVFLELETRCGRLLQRWARAHRQVRRADGAVALVPTLGK